MLGTRHWLAVLLVVASGAAHADPSPAAVPYVRACEGPGIRCGALIRTRSVSPLAIEIANLAPADIQAAYHIDPSKGAGVTVAIVDAYGYKALESDLAAYRSHFKLPACTTANGCLHIVNSDGQPSPLPTGTDAGWEAETALDMDMVSAACPACNITVVQTDGGKLDAGVRAAEALGVDAISASWGSIENGGELAREATYQHPGIGIFAASGDNAYDSGGMGPEYPATSQYVVAVGGTNLAKHIPADTFTESAWSLAGSSCSKNIAAPSFQPAAATAACAMRASSDVAADADPGTGVAVYEASAGGWLVVGGTSAATPIVAALMAAVGHGDIGPEFVYRHPEAFTDVTAGTNGSCGTSLCNAGSGWDGPTGVGSPLQSVLATIGGGAGPSVTITSPATGSTQEPGFGIAVQVGSGAAHVDVAIDGVRVGAFGPPFALGTPADTATGMHQVTVTAYDADHNGSAASIMVDVTAASGGCTAGGGSGGIGLLTLAVGLVTRRRRRGVFPTTA